MSHSIHNAARPEGSPWTECVAHQRIKNTVRRHQPRSTANDSSRNVPNADTKERRATLISSGNLSVSRAVEDDKPLTERAQLSAGGSVPTKHHATVTETAAGLMIGGPSEYGQFGVFLKTSMCATQSDRTHTLTARERVWLMWQRWC